MYNQLLLIFSLASTGGIVHSFVIIAMNQSHNHEPINLYMVRFGWTSVINQNLF